MASVSKPGILAYLNVALLWLLPQHWLSGLMYRAARSRVRWFKDAFIRVIVWRYRVDLNEAADPDISHYDSFNAFFTRALKPDARPVDPDPASIVSPADGQVSQAGVIADGRLLQAKGHCYEAEELLAGDADAASRYAGGRFATVYLSPRDYHRVHMPLAGRLVSMSFVPGDLFSVSDATTQLVPRLFARNERVICHFEGEHGPFAVILVGAIFVGSMETAWHGEVRGNGGIVHWHYSGDDAPRLAKGEEMGRFNMGSTVIVLLPDGTANWSAELMPGHTVRLGQAIGHLR